MGTVVTSAIIIPSIWLVLWLNRRATAGVPARVGMADGRADPSRYGPMPPAAR